MAALAARQHGVVGTRQLLDLGLSRRQVHQLTRTAVLHPVHRGVHAVGHRRLTRRGRWMAAVLAGGPDAVLSHLSAAVHWYLLDLSLSLPHITAPQKRRQRPGLHQHTARLAADEVTIRDGIPVTTVARTLLDLSSCLEGRRLERAVAEAEYRRYADSPSLRELIERHPGRRGVAGLRAILDRGHARRGVTVSPLEERFLGFLDTCRLERPELNAPFELGGQTIVVDCLWRRQRIALELDGRASHLRIGQWESDRVRDRRLLAAGWRPVRVTEEQLDSDAGAVADDLRALGVRAAGSLRDVRHGGGPPGAGGE